MHLLHLASALVVLSPLALAAPPAAVTTTATKTTYILPSATLSNGIANPFYPCGSANVTTCPYRCYTLPLRKGSQTPPTLDAQCYSAADAATSIASHNKICMQCLMPLPAEIPTNASAPPTCARLADYFTNLNYTSPPPARCGYNNGGLNPNCAWICGEAQVPFTLCRSYDESGMYERCNKCTPTCSTPRIVFTPPTLPGNFSLSAGGCGKDANETRACPFRCTDAGNQDYSYCSLGNRTGTFTSCTGCV